MRGGRFRGRGNGHGCTGSWMHRVMGASDRAASPYLSPPEHPRGGPTRAPTSTERYPTLIRLLTYNIRHCLGTDGQMAPERIAEVIASCEADVIALQEVDVGRAR